VPVRADEDYVIRSWEPEDGFEGADPEPLVSAILQNPPDAVSIQFNFVFFAPARLKQVIEALKRNGITVAVTMHSTQHDQLARYKPALSSADFCICHRVEDIENLRHLGLNRNLILQRQGIPAPPCDREVMRAGKRRAPGSFVISCFGFFLPAKGIHELIQAAGLVRNFLPLVQLNLVNALYPKPVSNEYANRCLLLIAEKSLGAHVTIRTEFLDDQSVLSELACSDLVVLPYLYSSESSSAAIRLPIASMTPVLCSDLRIFDEFSDCIHRFPAGDVIALSNQILRLAGDVRELNKFQAQQAKIVENLSWSVIAQQFSDSLIQRIIENRGNAAARTGA
jgi:glycosyltransferase involved in cell wall biosynthesis